MAVSARCTSASSSSSFPAEVMPMDSEVRPNLYSLKRSMMRRATTPALTGSVSRRSTTNSSPP